MYRKSKKLLVWCLVVSMVLTQMLFTNIALAATPNAGANRYETAAKVATAGWTTSDYAVLAYGEAFPDALAAAPLAAAYGAPILLTNNDKLDTYTKAALETLKVKNVIIVGGTGAVPAAVEAEVAAMPGMTVLPRVAGTDRIGTALAIAKAVEVKTGVAAADVFVVNSESYADALSISSLAAIAPISTIVLVDKDAVNADVAAYVGSKKAYAIGGTGVISDTVVSQLKAERVTEGTDRYGTNLAVLKTFADFKFDKVFVATGENYPDALAGSVYAAKFGSPLVLVDQAITADTMAFLKTKMPVTSTVYTLGGLATVASAASALEAAVAPVVPSAIGVESISAISLNQVKVVFNKEVDSTASQIVSNYSLGGTALTVGTDAAKLLDDKKTVIVTFAAGTITTQGTTKIFKVNDNVIQEKDTGVLVPKVEKELTFTDVTAPTVTGIKVTGNKKLTLTFSEAVDANAWRNSNYKVDGQSLSSFGGNATEVTGFYAAAGIESNQVDISFDAALSAGNHTLTIGADSNNKILDRVKFAFASTDMSFTVASAASTLSIVSITGNVNGKVTVTFSEKIDDTATGFGTAFTINGTQPAVVAPALDANDKHIVKMTFAANLVKEGANVLEIVKNTVTDIYGNKYSPDADARVSFTAVKDTTAPTITNTYAISETVVRVFFSENVDNTYFTNTNFVLKNASGDTKVGGTDAAKAWTSILYVAGSQDKVDLTIPGTIYPTLGKAQYTLTVKNVADAAGNPIVETSKAFTTIDTTKPTLATAPNVLVNTTNRTAKLNFNEPMDATSIGTKANYYYSIAGAAFALLPDAATLSVADDNKSITITFPSTITPTATTTLIRVLNVKDAAGNALAGGIAESGAASIASDSAGYPLAKADTLNIYSDSNKVWATFDVDQVLDSVDKTDFAFDPATTSFVAAGAGFYTPDSATRVNKTITLTWTDPTAKDALKAAGKTVKLAAASVFAGTLNAEGATLKVGTSDIKAVDHIAPKVPGLTVAAPNKAVTVTGAKVITITFNEALKNNPASYADDFTILVGGVMVDNSKVTAVIKGAGNNVLELTWTDTPAANVPAWTALNPCNIIVKAKSTTDIQDAAGNAYVPTSDDLSGLGIN